MKTSIIIYRLLRAPARIWNRTVILSLKKNMLKSCGINVRFGSNVQITWGNCSIGNDVYIGDNALFVCADAPLTIGDHIMFGPGCTIITGDHRTDIAGRYMSELTVKDKLPENDQPVLLKGDNWIGANSTILKGVTIGTGAIVAAGALVINDVPPYSIVGGVPASIISMRFSEEKIKLHEKILSESERMNDE